MTMVGLVCQGFIRDILACTEVQYKMVSKLVPTGF
jgi:hypothetical protein